MHVYGFYNPIQFPAALSQDLFSSETLFPSVSGKLRLENTLKDWQRAHIQFDKGAPQKGPLDT